MRYLIAASLDAFIGCYIVTTSLVGDLVALSSNVRNFEDSGGLTGF